MQYKYTFTGHLVASVLLHIQVPVPRFNHMAAVIKIAKIMQIQVKSFSYCLQQIAENGI